LKNLANPSKALCNILKKQWEKKKFQKKIYNLFELLAIFDKKTIFFVFSRN